MKDPRLKTQDSRPKTQDPKGVALIIVIFAMMLFAALGWTLANLQSTDFEANLRNLDSERALGLAEAGAQWAMRQLKEEFNCTNFNPNDSPPGILHNLNFGQYRVTCSCTDNPPNCMGSPELIIVSKGYVPLEGNFRAQRQIKIVVNQGAFARAGTAKNLFDWSAMHSGSEIIGDLRAGHFNGDGIDPLDEKCKDYGVKADCGGKQLPPGDGDRTQGATTLPSIDMDYYKQKAQGWNRYKNYSGTAEVSSGSSGEDLKVIGEGGIFDSSMDDEPEAVRRMDSECSGQDWAEKKDCWVVIKEEKKKKEESGYQASTWVKVYLKDGMNMSDWIGKTVRVVKRYAWEHNNEKLWFIEGSNILIDVRTEGQVSGDEINIKNIDKQAFFKSTSLVAEGDIMIIGSKGIAMNAYVDISAHETFPNLATQNSNIISTYTPEGMTESIKAGNRSFDGLIYTQNGDVRFNYINGTAVMGNNIYLDGLVKLKYIGKYIDSDGFLGAVASNKWQEQ